MVLAPRMTAAACGALILVRHGQSTWNLENRFTGWADVPLTERGVQEALHAGRLLRDSGIRVDVAYTSVLQRAVTSADRVLSQLRGSPIELRQRWQLNERHYGALTGLQKKEEAPRLFGRTSLVDWR